MSKRLCVCILIMTLLLLSCCHEDGGATVTTSGNGDYYGQLSIPARSIDSPLHCDGCPPCCTVLFNGGRILADSTQLFTNVKVGDIAYIDSEIDGVLVLECVEIVDCLQKLCPEKGDVLMYACSGWWPIVRVYRWIIL